MTQFAKPLSTFTGNYQNENNQSYISDFDHKDRSKFYKFKYFNNSNFKQHPIK